MMPVPRMRPAWMPQSAPAIFAGEEATAIIRLVFAPLTAAPMRIVVRGTFVTRKVAVKRSRAPPRAPASAQHRETSDSPVTRFGLWRWVGRGGGAVLDPACTEPAR
jgi:hypothetical protein